MANHSYAYAMGRVRAVERRMLGRAQFERILEARSPDDALRVLQEAEYGDRELSGREDGATRDYERLLDEENGKVVKFITEISPEPGLLSVFLHRYDYHNLKVLLKAEFSDGGAGMLPLSGAGIYQPAQLERILRERALSELPPEMAAGVREAIDAFQKSVSVQLPDPQVIDIRLDRAMYAQMLREALALDNRFLTGLVRVYIDIANIGAFIRMRAMRKGPEFLRGTLIPGGVVEIGLFARCLGEGLENFAAATQFSPYGQLCEDAVKSYQATGLLTVFERLADDYVITYVKAAKLFPAGLEVLVAYFVARQSELKNVRIAIAGKLNNIAADVLRERLRETYV